jgi:putative Holliday junction resolvase
VSELSVLGVDVGTVRVGLAGCDPTGAIATPLETLPRRNEPAMWARLDAVIAERAVTRMVVGLPRRLDGSEGEAAAMARAFGETAQRRTGLDIVWWDERFTTAAAERSLISAGARRDRRREKIDAVAAALMLQSWLDSRTRS